MWIGTIRLANIMKKIEIYTTLDNKCPYLEWLNSLSLEYKVRIQKRINRMYDGNYGDFKKLQNSELSELRLDFGKGYRVYFKELNNVIILIIAGSDKSNQIKTIKKADEYLKEYLSRKDK